MDKQAGKAQVQQSNALTSIDYDYEQGLKVLARLIVRIHMQRTTNKLGNKDGFPKDKI